MSSRSSVNDLRIVSFFWGIKVGLRTYSNERDDYYLLTRQNEKSSPEGFLIGFLYSKVFSYFPLSSSFLQQTQHARKTGSHFILYQLQSSLLSHIPYFTPVYVGFWKSMLTFWKSFVYLSVVFTSSTSLLYRADFVVLLSKTDDSSRLRDYGNNVVSIGHDFV